MATTPVPTPSLPTPSQVVTNTESWLKQHETIIICVLILTGVLFVVQKYFDVSSLIENHKFQQAQATLAVQQQAANASLDQAKALLAQYQQEFAQAEAANAQLVASMANRNKTLVVQQAVDAKATPTDLATRWETLTNTTGIVDTSSGFTVPQTSAVETVQQLEQVPVLKQNLTDETTKETNDNAALTKANDLIAQGKIAVNGLTLELSDQTKSCTAQVSAVQATAKKKTLKTFFAGFVAGFIAGVTKPW